MTILESELLDRLRGDDETIVETTLRRYFQPRPRFTAPFIYDWIPLPDLNVVLGDGQGGGLYEAAARRVLDAANAADAGLRMRRFKRRWAQHADWPVVLCEGDSWISHPFIHDMGDHLVDDPLNRFHLLNRAAAGDRLTTVAAEGEHLIDLARIDVAVLVVSGGGNDLLLSFDRFLRPGPHDVDTQPAQLVTDALETRMAELMQLIRRVLSQVREQSPTLPIIVHGYDYLRVAEPGRASFLAPHFDAADIRDLGQRQRTLDYIIDRYNHHVAHAVGDLAEVDYVDLRGRVGDHQWYDEIHPDADGFGRLSETLGAAMRQRLDAR